MSRYATNRVLWEVAADGDLAQRLHNEPQTALAGRDLTEEERTALAKADVRALFLLGVVTLLYLLLINLDAGAEIAAVIALVVLEIQPILAGTYAGVSEADGQVVDAAKGMGMTGSQKLWQVELPIALPLLLGGVRNAMLQLVATAAVAAYIGLGGLGQLLIEGISLNDYPEVVAGAVFVAVLAVLADLVLGAVQRAVTPRGVRLADRAAKGK